MRTVFLVVFLFLFVINTATAEPARDEINAYLKSSSKCKVKHGTQALKVGINSYHDWSRARALKLPKPKNAWRDSYQAFKFLYKSGCKDGLVIYRYANMLRLTKKHKKALKIMETAIEDTKINYPQYLTRLYIWTADSAESDGNYPIAIKYYRLVLKADSNNPSMQLNFANTLSKAGLFDESEELIKLALKIGVSSYGEKFASKIRNRNKRNY